MELVASFFNLVLLKNNINTAIIQDNDISETVLLILKNISKVNNIIFTENSILNYTISSLLLENIYLEKIECYNMPEIMICRFKNDVVELRSKIKNKSEFLLHNNIITYPNLLNKNEIIIGSFITENDIDDIIYFFENNISLKKIIFKGYKNDILLFILKQIKINKFKNIKIIIYEDSSITNQLINDIDLFKKYNKQYNVKIIIKYSKLYKDKNKSSEINVIFFRIIIIIIIIITISFIIVLKNKEYNETNNLKELNNDIEQILNDDILTSENNDENDYNSIYYNSFENSYEKLFKINSDTVGFLKVKGTEIKFPVVQTNNNDYYLNHAFDKSLNSAGWIFVDYRDNIDTSKNIIIYGHNLKKNDFMFGTLKNVLNNSWYSNEKNHIIEFSIKDKIYYWKVFSIYTTEVTSDYLITDFYNNNSYQTYLNTEKEKSIFNFNVDVTINDRIITLQTCYKNSNNRLVVHAKLIND